MPCPFHPPWFDHPNIWWRVQNYGVHHAVFPSLL
jgi:hypothetical protein